MMVKFPTHLQAESKQVPVISYRIRRQGCVGTLVERKTGFVVLSKMASKSAQDIPEGFEAKMQTPAIQVDLSVLRLYLFYPGD